ncbi:Ligand-binding domain of nuclear hormone receptor [Necator americanus]|uniref:Ligand-binding domain of nuclear hormone receptor n=1 Tax=Necator americanus TaxID=51031 RepID=W2TVL5_NECAM|nr:Ligand-binding domain of nuclear hormone receptor [Necator americanus]ETN85106.1 Ligand-binding domain of nuclear hormone receptor [Necator americanus]
MKQKKEHSLCPSTADSAAPDLKPADNVIPISTAESTATSGYNNYPFPLKETEQHRILFDISHIMEKLRKILIEFQPDESLPIEPLERMRLALLRHRRSQLTEPSLKILDSLSFVNYLTSWETLLCGIAEWLMHCREFAQLPIEEKVNLRKYGDVLVLCRHLILFVPQMVLFKSSWIIWHRFERTTMSIELFGWRAVTEKLFAVSFRHAIMTDKVKFDIAPLSDHDPDYVKRMFEPFSGRLTEEVTKTCLEVNITLVEVAYILCTLVWHVEGKGVSPRTQAVAELYRDRISDDLHNYYTLTMKTSNYAGRLIRIMSIIQCIENIHHERSKVLELARIFDIFKVEMSEKGMFGC